VNVITVTPVLTPCTTPVAATTVATDGLLLVQLVGQELSESVSVIVAPTHNALGPPIADGVGLIVMVAVPDIVRGHPVIAFVATIV